MKKHSKTPQETPSIRLLAAQLRLSPTTVSESLRGVARVSAKTSARVREAAERLGYTRNPLVGAMMTQMRLSQASGFQGSLGLIDIAESYRPEGSAIYHARLEEGAKQRCRELGFTLDRFVLGTGGLSPTRLNTVLAARNIRGVLVLPAYSQVELVRLDWGRLAGGIYLDRVIQSPALHCVGPNHFDAIWLALEEMKKRGYRRPGLVLQRRQDERLRHRWEGGFQAWCSQSTQAKPAPILVAETVTEGIFSKWFRRHRPDFLMGHGTHFLEWIRRAGGRVPETGFVCLNEALCKVPCAAVDLQPTQIGRIGAELLVGQILRGGQNDQTSPSLTTPPPRWIDGPTLQPQR